jgi:hypothetical protein
MKLIDRQIMKYECWIGASRAAPALASGCKTRAVRSGPSAGRDASDSAGQALKLQSNEPSDNGKFETPVPPGHETDLITLNQLSGETFIPDGASVERRRGTCKLTPRVFEGLAPRVKIDGIFIVAPKGGQVWPPDMAGIGPFYLVRAGGRYFLLTRADFARVAGPMTRVAEVPTYLRTYEALVGNRLGTITTEASKGGRSGDGQPPEITKTEGATGGFGVRLVIYQALHQRVHYAKMVEVKRNGFVASGATTLLKNLGRGVWP